ncbi:BTAD domain-containing putative transcriptional regulator [Streptomyces sp. NPDC007940]|uniref:AfsR/SARP family transcriptional regulator n=1 Tax=Streptomyces sp. NPDC007940 TaxID=3364796 RepID=UPI0036EC4077
MGADPCPVRLSLLGGFRLDCATAEVDVCATAQRLLAYLGLRRRAPRGMVADVLWPEATEERAGGNLRTTLWRLHRGRVAAVRSHQDTLWLDGAVSVDVHALAGAALGVVSAPNRPEATRDGVVLRQLLGHGDLLPGWTDDWVLIERERLRQLRLHALDTLAARFIAQGRHALALEAASAAVRIEPLRESAHRLVVSAHLAAHDEAAAERHLRAFHDRLPGEAGRAPAGCFGSAPAHTD